MQITKSVQLDLRKNTHKIIDIAKQWDRDSRIIEFEIIEDGALVSIDNTVCYAMIAMKKPDGKNILNDCTIQDNIIKVLFTEQMLSVPGVAVGELRIYDIENKSLAITSTFKIRINDNVIDDFEIQSTHEYNALTNIVLNSQAVISEAKEATTNAISATNAIIDTNNEIIEAENVRVTNETQRSENETSRASSEQLRVQAEIARESTFNSKIDTISSKISQSESATEAANTATQNANSAAEAALSAASGDISNKTVTFTTGSSVVIPESGETLADITGKVVSSIDNLNSRLSGTIDADTLDGHDASYFATGSEVNKISTDIGDISDLSTTDKSSVVSAISELVTKLSNIYKASDVTTDCNSPASYWVTEFTNYDGTGNAPNREVRGILICFAESNYPDSGRAMPQLFISYYGNVYIRVVHSGETFGEWISLSNNFISDYVNSMKGTSNSNERRITMVTQVTGQDVSYISIDVSAILKSSEILSAHPMALVSVNSGSTIGVRSVGRYHDRALIVYFDTNVPSGTTLELALQFNVTSTS